MTRDHQPEPRTLAKPTYAPIAIAAGILLAVWGLIAHWILSALGLVIAGIGARRWILDLIEQDR